MEDLKTPKGHFEINWPLPKCHQLQKPTLEKKVKRQSKRLYFPGQGVLIAMTNNSTEQGNLLFGYLQENRYKREQKAY